MAISCDCDFDGGLVCVGDPREVTCRTPAKCLACGKDIAVGERKYMWPCYDYDEYKPAPPVWFCEECGDMALNLLDAGYCFSITEPIRKQWLEYKAEAGIK